MERNRVGYILFKEVGDDIERIRIINQYQKNSEYGVEDWITVKNLESGKTYDMKAEDLFTYKILMADGLLMLSEVIVGNQHDIIVASYLRDQLRNNKMIPFCVCRQCVTDLYYNLLIKEESDMISGMSMNILNVPQGFDYGMMLLSDKVVKTHTLMIYKSDRIEDVLDTFGKYINIDKYDTVMRNNYSEHCKEYPEAMFDDEHKGWCKSLKRLLTENNFQSDLDEMFGITTVDFVINDYLTETKVTEDSEESYTTVTDELRYWLSYLYKLNINRVYVLPYDYDINMDDLKQSRYFIFRDKENKLYILVYTLDGEYKEAELEEKDKQLDFSTKFRINFLDKYKHLHPEEFEQEHNLKSTVIDITNIKRK